MSAIVDADKFTAARDAMLAEVEKMKTTPVSAGELGKAVKQFIAATLATRKTMEGQAQNLGGNWLAANDLNFSERYLAAVKRVRPDDVLRVAREYLTAENRTLYALLPNGTAPKLSVAVEENSEHAIQKFELPNGLRLLVKEDHRLPFVEFRAMFQGGVLAETSENNGITQLTSRMLLKGTSHRSARDIATEIESVGGSIDSYGGNNSFGVNLETMSSDFATGLDLLADVLLNPVFPADALEREREVQIADIYAQKGQSAQKRQPGHAPRAFWQHRLRPGFNRHGGSRRQTQSRRLEIVSQKTGRAEQLRSGHLRRRENGGGQIRRRKSILAIGNPAMRRTN